MSDQMVTFRYARQLTGLLGAAPRLSWVQRLDDGAGTPISRVGAVVAAIQRCWVRSSQRQASRRRHERISRTSRGSLAARRSRLVANVPNTTSHDRSPTRTNAPWRHDLSASSP